MKAITKQIHDHILSKDVNMNEEEFNSILYMVRIGLVASLDKSSLKSLAESKFPDRRFSGKHIKNLYDQIFATLYDLGLKE